MPKSEDELSNLCTTCGGDNWIPITQDTLAMVKSKVFDVSRRRDGRRITNVKYSKSDDCFVSTTTKLKLIVGNFTHLLLPIDIDGCKECGGKYWCEFDSNPEVMGEVLDLKVGRKTLKGFRFFPAFNHFRAVAGGFSGHSERIDADKVDYFRRIKEASQIN